MWRRLAPPLLGWISLTGCEARLDLVRAGRASVPDAFQQAAFAPFSWLGNSAAGGAGRALQQRVSDLFVAPDGTVFTYADRRSTNTRGQILRSGAFVGRLEGDGEGGQSITSDGALLYADQRHDDGPRVARFDLAGGPVGQALALDPGVEVGGLAVSRGELFVADRRGGRVLVFAADATGRATPARSWEVPGAGEMAFDHGGLLWVVQERDEARRGRVRAFDRRGVAVADGVIEDVEDPRDVAVDPRNRLLVAEAGGAHQIRIYGGLAGRPRLEGTFGAAQGVFAAPAGRLEPGRLHEPNAVGADAAGNLYVNSAAGGFSSSVESFDAGGRPLWSVHAHGYLFDAAVLDPEIEGVAYGRAHRYRLDFTQPPGHEATAVGFLRDLPRTDPLEESPFHVVPLGVRRIGGRRFLLTADNGRGAVGFYRLPDGATEGELARPALVLRRGSVTRLWRDDDGDGRVDAGEWASEPQPSDGWVIWADDAGNLWTGGNRGSFTVFRQAGLDARGAPVYPAERRQAVAVPAPFGPDGVRRVFHLPREEALFVAGFTAERPYVAGADPSLVGTTLARYAAPFSPGGPRLVWSARIDDGPVPGPPRAMDVVGRFAFLGHTDRGLVVVRDLDEGGRIVATFAPPTGGVLLHTEGLKAFRIASGEHVVFVQDSLWGRVSMHRWNPRAPAGLVATRAAGGIAVDWTAPVEGRPAGYVVFRSTESRRNYARVTPAPIEGPPFQDAAPPPGPAFYRVAALYGGEEAVSYEVAAP
jgi:hypothetical protein